MDDGEKDCGYQWSVGIWALLADGGDSDDFCDGGSALSPADGGVKRADGVSQLLLRRLYGEDGTFPAGMGEDAGAVWRDLYGVRGKWSADPAYFPVFGYIL